MIRRQVRFPYLPSFNFYLPVKYPNCYNMSATNSLLSRSKLAIFTLIALMLFIFAYCNTITHHNTFPFPVTYAGNLPCADCSALYIKITFHANHTYSELDIYKNTPHGDKSFRYQGKWKWEFQNISDKLDTLFVLNPEDTTQNRYYLLAKGQIQLLTHNKKLIHSPFNNSLKIVR